MKLVRESGAPLALTLESVTITVTPAGGPGSFSIELHGMLRSVGADSGKAADPVVVFVKQQPRAASVERLLAHRYALTPAECRVAMLLAERLSNREIASRCGIAEHTARRHTEQVLRKLHVHSRRDVAAAIERLARRRGAAPEE